MGHLEIKEITQKKNAKIMVMSLIGIMELKI